MSVRRPLTLVVALAAATALTVSACGSSSSGSTGASATSGSAVASAPAAAAVSSSAASSAGSSAAAPSAVGATGSSQPASSVASSGAGSVSLTGCTPADLKTVAGGTLTIATDNPAYDPWFSGNDPSNGKGFESAVAYAVATKLGYTKAQVKWVKESFNAAISPAPKNFDFDINEFTITAERAKAVDFSTSYYDVTQAVVTVKGSKIASAKSVADLKGAKLGAQIGTTSLDALNGVIAPSSKATIFPTNDAAVAQLKNGQVDGIVVDTPTAFYMASAQLDNGVIVGQLPSGSGKPDQFGLLLDKGSPLTACASKAVDALRADGTLTKLQTTWLANAGAPVLK
ncbi:amino acid ABC transporter substrate-binding protein, PAAT family [Nakamurella panacisegetis]|uniref:Amino acid ABC transporter substrate-binding protein, PAAT family n=1 Tax=Nakamurella panacisegetis TaxID=1090615 RepID=A0A1H0KBR8_9ACTN|nr:transporter substrate-binding domain-containing protein [Nakamurella panacisegetis]SDO53279.1 amino acid ABC transporter substrate-binding protein, PAAT family [Nakamurella panacisegetis]